MSRQLDFFVPGTPVAQGSMRAGKTKTGRPFVMPVESAKLNVWRNTIKDVAEDAMELAETGTFVGPVGVSVAFVFPALSTAPERVWKHTPADLDKLIRASLDALTKAGIYEDDSRVVVLSASKRHAQDDEPIGAEISVWSVAADPHRAMTAIGEGLATVWRFITRSLREDQHAA